MIILNSCPDKDKPVLGVDLSLMFPTASPFMDLPYTLPIAMPDDTTMPLTKGHIV